MGTTVRAGRGWTAVVTGRRRRRRVVAVVAGGGVAVVRLGRGRARGLGLGGRFGTGGTLVFRPAPDAAAEPPDAMLMSSPGVSSLDVPAGWSGSGW